MYSLRCIALSEHTEINKNKKNNKKTPARMQSKIKRFCDTNEHYSEISWLIWWLLLTLLRLRLPLLLLFFINSVILHTAFNATGKLIPQTNQRFHYIRAVDDTTYTPHKFSEMEQKLRWNEIQLIILALWKRLHGLCALAHSFACHQVKWPMNGAYCLL